MKMPARLLSPLTLLGCLIMGCAGESSEIAQDGVTWRFAEEVTFGTYANGDHWVLGPVTIEELLPAFDGAHHGFEVNPADSSAQGFDARIADYDATRVPALPYTAEPGQSIVKAISLEPLGDTECRPCLQAATVLTVVAEVPPDAGATVFRPPYFGPAKPSYATGALRTELLPRWPPTASTPDLAALADELRRVQLDHKEGWTGRPMHPADSMPDYGSSIAGRNAEAALRLMLDDEVADKLPALIGYVQQGIDLYHMALGGVTWSPNGGHGEGRKLPVTFAAVLLGDPDMQSFVAGAGPSQFGENGGMYESEAAGVVLFGQVPNSEEQYWTNIVFDTGSRTIIDPYRMVDGGYRPGDSYQFCCTSLPWKSTATALRLMPELIDVWSYQPFFDYVDRWVTLGAWAEPDPCAPPSGLCAGGDNDGTPCTSASVAAACQGAEAYCDLTVSWDSDYGVTYGPDGNGGCIADSDPSDGTGRFPQLHGTSTDDGHYGSALANELWDAHLAAE